MLVVFAGLPVLVVRLRLPPLSSTVELAPAVTSCSSLPAKAAARGHRPMACTGPPTAGTGTRHRLQPCQFTNGFMLFGGLMPSTHDRCRVSLGSHPSVWCQRLEVF